jgi:ferritin-like metal-binding protein YciE
MIAQRGSCAIGVQSVNGESTPESADSIDPFSFFESELPGCDNTAVVPSQAPTYGVTVLTAEPTSERSDAGSVSREAPNSTYTTTRGRQSDHETAESLRDQETELVYTTLHRLCSDIEARLVRTEDAVHELCDVAAGTPLHRLCAEIASRLTRTEEALEKTVEHTVELGRHIDARFARTEDALRRVHETIAENSRLPELCASIDERLSRTEEALRRTESLVADRTVQQLSARIDVRVAETENAIRRIERFVESAQLHHLSAKIEGRFAEAEERLRRLASLLEAGAARAAGANHVLAEDNRTIDDRNGSSGPAVAGQRFVVSVKHGWRLPRLVRHHIGSTMAAIRFPATQTVAGARLSAPRRVPIAATPGATGAVQRAARRCAPAVVLFVAMAVVAIFRNDARIDSAPLPIEPWGKTEVGPERLTLLLIEALREPPAAPVREANAVSDLAARPSRQAPIAQQPAKTSEFLGSLSIASVPPGATVFINGRLVGVTPLEVTDRRAGSLALQITREGFERWTAAIQVPAGRLTQVRATLRPSAP